MVKNIHLNNVSLRGALQVPGDKSMSHRSVIFGALAKGKTVIHQFLLGEDCLRTVKAFEQMGVRIEQTGQTIEIESKGAYQLKEPLYPIDFGNSGTTARLMLGVLAGQPFHSVLVGDDSLSKRPMDRVTVPIQEMGAQTDGRLGGKFLPMSIRGGQLSPMTYELPVNSAQVKSAVLLAGLFAKGTTTVIEPTATRDHTERMIRAFGGEISREGQHISIQGGQELQGTELTIPGDISSASFFVTGAILANNSQLVIQGVGLNETRTGILDVLKQMGAQITLEQTESIGDEPVGNIHVETSSLKGITISGDMIPRVIDEIPLLALAATQAEGETIIRDAKELRFKETDRIEAVVQVLSVLGAKITALDDGMKITGPTALKGGQVSSYGDHRIGMMAAIASFITQEEVAIENPSCINISYPNFFEHLDSITK
nr:3-phosphoshikimate 1-carboxyvinyltransferase [Salinibacillus xinjiangensis]